MENITTKIEVLNPISLFNTVGEELRDFFYTNNLDLNDLCKIDISPERLATETKFTKQKIKDIIKLTGTKEIANYLISFQKDYQNSKIKAELDFKNNKKVFSKVKHLVPLLKNDFEGGMDLLEDISDFLDIEDENEIFEKVNENIALYKISNFEPDNLNLYAWLKRGELDFYKLDLPEYNANLFQEWIDKREWRNNLHNTNYLENLSKILSNFGVALIFTPYLHKTVHGAVRWFENKPLVQISDKNKCLATIWYSLFHEFGHVIKHRNDIIFEGNLDLPKSKINKKEKEANAFAYDYLFGGDNLRKHIFKYKGQYVDDSFILQTQSQFEADKMFIAYWMLKAQLKNKNIRRNLPSFSFQ